MSKPKFDLAAGEYRVLSGPGQGGQFGPSHPQPPAEISRPPIQQWYRRRFFARSTTTTRVVGRKRPKIVTNQEELEATVGLVLGAAALLLGWEIGTSISHGLAGVDPLNWVGDVENWLTGKSSTPPKTASTIGGRIQLSILEFLDGSPPPVTQTSSSSSGGGGGGSSTPFFPHLLPIIA